MALNSTVSRSNWNLEMLVFAEGGKPEYPEKNSRSRDGNQQQTQPTYDAETSFIITVLLAVFEGHFLKSFFFLYTGTCQ